ncbi:MAG: phage regulatory CII family protein [Pseudomonadota bacterium]
MELFNPQVLWALIHQMPDRSGVSLAGLAQAAGKEYKTLSREMFPDDAGAKLALDTFVYITHRARDFAALDYMETALGRVAFELPCQAISTDALLQHLARMGKEMGEVISQIAGDLADGKLDDPEAALKEIHEAAQALAALRAAVLLVLRQKRTERPRVAHPVNQ